MEQEYEGVDSVRFLHPSHVKMYDGEGNVVLCKCGKPAEHSAVGKDACAAWCGECSPLNQDTQRFVYRAPTEERIKKLKDMGLCKYE